MIPRLSVPDFLVTSPSLYGYSCRAALVLTTSLGVQMTAFLMIAIGPRAESPYDPRTLTRVGRSMLTVEYDPQAYAAGCLVTVILSCVGIWTWNRMVFHVHSEISDEIMRRGMRLMLVLAAASSLGFGTAIVWISPRLAGARRVAESDLLVLATPTLLASACLLFAFWTVWRGARGEPA
jgi:hypothetical protein